MFWVDERGLSKDNVGINYKLAFVGSLKGISLSFLVITWSVYLKDNVDIINSCHVIISSSYLVLRLRILIFSIGNCLLHVWTDVCCHFDVESKYVEN